MTPTNACRFASQVMMNNALRRDAAQGIGALIDKCQPKCEGP